MMFGKVGQTILHDDHRRIGRMISYGFCRFAFDVVEIFFSSIPTEKNEDHANDKGQNNGDGNEKCGEEQNAFGRR